MEGLARDPTIDIFSRLPMKSVVRCTSVSKSLEALLTDPSFAEDHFKSVSTRTPYSNYIIREGNEIPYFVEIEEDDDETSTMSKPKHLNYSYLGGIFTNLTRPILMGACLGYVALSATEWSWPGAECPTNPMYLLNPITGENILLPQFQETRVDTGVYGFGFDVSTQACKVVLVYLREKTFSVQVHTVGRDYSWRTNTVPTMLTDLTKAELEGELQVSLPLGFNGSIHWIVLSSVDKDNKVGPKRACILSFRLDAEVFTLIPLPEPLQVMEPYFHNSMRYALQVCGGCLSIIYSPQPSIVDSWVMADYNISDSWVKKYSIQLNRMRRCEIRPIGFLKNGELILHLPPIGLVSYNTDSDTYQILRSCRDVSFPLPFVASLISLKSAYGDNEVVGIAGFGNPILKQKWTSRFENGVFHVQEPSSD